MKILFCGDIVGKNGRLAIAKYIPILKEKIGIDLVVANAENAAHGFGITPKIYNELTTSGVDVFTLGNHFLDQPVITNYLEQKANIIRPLNLSDGTIGKGYCTLEINGLSVLIVNVIGQLFMKSNTVNPFLTLDTLLNNYSLKKNIDIILVDIHAEATSEKNALFLYLNGRVSAALGTHTHMPTNDFRILSKGTAVQSDVGMCGDYNSVVGMTYCSSIERFLRSNLSGNKGNFIKLEPATQYSTLCGTLIEIDSITGLASKISPIIMGDILKNTIDLNLT